MDIQELIEQYTDYKTQYALEQAEYEKQRKQLWIKFVLNWIHSVWNSTHV